MNRAFIQQVFDRIDAELPQIKKKGLFNDDFEKNNEGTKQQIYFPALFISFPEPIQYVDYGGGNQKTTDFIMRLHIGVKIVDEKRVLDAFDLKQAVFVAFHKWKPQGATSLTRVFEQTDESRPGYYVFIQDYSLTLTDSDGWFENKLVPTTLDELRLQKKVRINPSTVEKIRTDKPDEE